jgi:hypothetical protein
MVSVQTPQAAEIRAIGLAENCFRSLMDRTVKRWSPRSIRNNAAVAHLIVTFRSS